MAIAADQFYLEAPRPELSQGDLYLAPTAMVWAEATHAAPGLIPSAPEEVGQTVFLRAWTRGSSTPASVPAVTLAMAWTPVLVLSHDCEIDKEWNEYVDVLIADGVPDTEAEAMADARSDLDRFIVVTPLLPYTASILPERSWDAVRSAQKIGYFPLVPMQRFEGAEFMSHLSRMSTIERQLLAHSNKIGSLTEQGRRLLRFKLAEVLASRNLTVVGKLEAAIGRRIEDVRTLRAKRPDVTVALVLDDGTQLEVGMKANLANDAPASRLPRRP